MIRAAVGKFSAWFQSDAGTAQSFVVFTGGVLVELIWPHLDPSHFWYLFLCTYWSAFTCNALANASRRDGKEVMRKLDAIKAEEDQLLNHSCSCQRTSDAGS